MYNSIYQNQAPQIGQLSNAINPAYQLPTYSTGGYTPLVGYGQQQQQAMLGGNLAGASGGVVGNNQQKPSFFQKGGAGQFALGALSTGASLWNSFQQNKLANKALNSQTGFANANLANTTDQYNTSFEGRANARYAAEGRSGEAAAYIAANRLPDRTV